MAPPARTLPPVSIIWCAGFAPSASVTSILGISAFYHDSAAALVIDGEIVAAAQEERFTRKKHDAAFPARAIEYCLREAGIDARSVDYVTFYEKPLLKFDRLLETSLAFAPRGFSSFCAAMPVWLKDKLFLRRTLRRGLGDAVRAPLVFPEHHESHAASAFFPSPFDKAAILTLDGVGEWATASSGMGEGNKIRLTHELAFPHSLGLLYSAFTSYCGFRVNSGEYKLMGLAPYGKPVYAEAIRKHVVTIGPDGAIWLDMDYFNYCQGLTMTNARFHRLLGGEPRKPEAEIEQRHKDLAASIQTVTEEVVLRMGRALHGRTCCRDLVLAGGVALNCVANGRLLREGPFDRIWVQPAAGDAGGALGAALFVWHQLLDGPREHRTGDSQRASRLGPAYPSSEVRAVLDSQRIPYRHFEDRAALSAHVAEALAAGRVAGWFQGRMEFGPRALGSRSILADPRGPAMREALNRKIKFRETFRPFAPCVPVEHAAEWFDITSASPYMLITALARNPAAIPAVSHVDGSARVQTVDRERHPELHALLEAFGERSGCPVLINTSFNVRGEPLVCTPEDALRCFLATDIDLLVLEDCVIDKRDTGGLGDAGRAVFLSRFDPD